MRLRTFVVATMVGVAPLFQLALAYAQNVQVQIETVNRYAAAGCSWGSNLPASNTNGTNFANELIYTGDNVFGFQTGEGYWWEDGDVWDSDFLDPDQPFQGARVVGPSAPYRTV